MQLCSNGYSLLQTGGYVVGGPFAWPMIVACRADGPVAVRAALGAGGQAAWFIIAGITVSWLSEKIYPTPAVSVINNINDVPTTIPSIYTNLHPSTSTTTVWPGREIWISSGKEWGIQRQLLWFGSGTRLVTYRNGTMNLMLANKTETELPPDLLEDVLKKVRVNVEEEEEKLRDTRDLRDVGTRMAYPSQISRSIRAYTTPSAPDDWVGFDWWNLRSTTTSSFQEPVTPSSRDRKNTFINTTASMLTPSVDLMATDTTAIPPVISVEDETTEMEDGVTENVHSYNASTTSHTTNVRMPVILPVEEVNNTTQDGYEHEEEDKNATFYRWQKTDINIVDNEKQDVSQNNFNLDERSRNETDTAIVMYVAATCITLVIFFLIICMIKRSYKRIYKSVYKKKYTFQLRKQFPGLENAPVQLTELPLFMPDSIINEQASELESIYIPPKTEITSEKIETKAIIHQSSDQPSDDSTSEFDSIDLALEPQAPEDGQPSAPPLDEEADAPRKQKVTDLQDDTPARPVVDPVERGG